MLAKQKVPKFDPKLKAAAEKSLELAGDWLVGTQVRDRWPFWDANKGRFIYHVRIDPKKRAAEPLMLSTCWKTARAAQGLYSAYSVTGNKDFLAAAELGMEYVCSLQFFEPGYEQWHGTFREDSPHGPHLALRDGMEACQGFINGYLVNGNERYLRRAGLYADYLVKHFRHELFPWGIAFPFGQGGNKLKHQFFCFYAGALVFAQLWAITKKEEYITRAMVPMANYILRNYVLDSGALGIKDEAASGGHHGALTEHGHIIYNDDGVGVALLSVYLVTGEKKYLDAAIGMGDFWVTTGLEPKPLAAYSSIALFLADLYRLTGDKKYLPVIEQFTRKTISLQYGNKKDPLLYGGFIGEDMAEIYDKKSKPTDWVDLRITSYTMILLGKLAARSGKQWGCAYSCFGW